MTIQLALLLLGVGILIGATSGMVGIGGGILIIPVLTIFLGFSQARANGTSLAMLLPPIGVLAVLAYAKAGNVDWPVAGLLAGGFFIGAAVGGVVVNKGWIDPSLMRILFAMLLLYVAGRTLFRPGGQARGAVETIVLIGVFTVSFYVLRLLGRRWSRDAGRLGAVYRSTRVAVSDFDYEI